MLGAALYIYFHLHLLKLWEALDDARAVLSGLELRARAYPWLVNDVAIRRIEGAGARPMAWLSGWVTWLLVWLSGPAVVGYGWWRSWPAHEEWMTLLSAACLLLMLYAGFKSRWYLRRRLSDRGSRRFWWSWWRAPLALVLGVAVVGMSWLKTEGGLEEYVATQDEACTLFDEVDFPNECWWRGFVWTTAELDALRGMGFGQPKTSAIPTWISSFFALVPADLTEAELSIVPQSWRGRVVALRRFRTEWCRNEEVPMSVCEPAPQGFATSQDVLVARTKSCERYDVACINRFEFLETRFEAAWSAEAAATARLVEKADLRGHDLRRASMPFAVLVHADLRCARLNSAWLNDAILEGAQLQEANAEGSLLVRTQMAASRLDDANLAFSRLDGAILYGATLRSATLTGANLSSASFAAADLNLAQLNAAALIGTRLVGADLLGASLNDALISNVDVAWAVMPSDALALLAFVDPPSRGAALRAVDLSEALEVHPAFALHAFGDGSVTLPTNGAWADLSPGRGPLAHWRKEKLKSDDFYRAWRDWRRAEGMAWPPQQHALDWLEYYN